MRVQGQMIQIGGPEAWIRAWPQIMKVILMEMCAYWHEHVAERHFGDGAAARYRYKQRTAAYNKRKLKKKGHQRPLEWSGRTKDQVLRPSRISGTSRSATLHITVERYIYYTKERRRHFKRKGGGGGVAVETINLADEILRTPGKDRRELERHGKEILHAELNGVNTVQVKSF